MSKIDAQIKILQLKKKKIDYVSYIADLVKNDTKCLDFRDVQQEVVAKIEPFLIELMTAIENDKDDKKEVLELDQKEIEVLKTVVKSIVNRPEKVEASKDLPKEVTPVVPKPPAPKPPETNPHDKMNFALDNRHLADQKVQVINDEKVQVIGKVVGLDAPYVLVKTETGPTIKVPIEKVVLL